MVGDTTLHSMHLTNNDHELLYLLSDMPTVVSVPLDRGEGERSEMQRKNRPQEI